MAKTTKNTNPDKHLSNLLKKLNVDYNIINDRDTMTMIIDAVRKYPAAAINDKLETIMPFRDTKSFFNRQKRVTKVLEVNFKQINTEAEFVPFRLRSVQSEKYFGQDLYDSVDLFTSKPEIMGLVDFLAYNVKAKVNCETLTIRQNTIIDVFKKLSTINELKYLGEYFLISMGLFMPATNKETLDLNIKNIEDLLSADVNVNLMKLLELKYFGDGLDRSNQPLWEPQIKETIQVFDIGSFSIGDKGNISNVFIEADYRSTRIISKNQNESIIDKIMKFSINKIKSMGYQQAFITSKNPKMINLINKYNFTILGSTYTPLNWPGSTIPNEIAAALPFDNQSLDTLQNNFINIMNPVLFTPAIEIPRPIGATTETIERLNQIKTVNQVNIQDIKDLIRYQIHTDSLKYIGITKGPLARKFIDVQTLEETTYKTLLFSIKDTEDQEQLFSYPIIKLYIGTRTVATPSAPAPTITMEPSTIELMNLIQPVTTSYIPGIILVDETDHTDTLRNLAIPELNRKPKPNQKTRYYPIHNQPHIESHYDIYEDLEFVKRTNLMYGKDIFINQVLDANDFISYHYDDNGYAPITFKVRDQTNMALNWTQLLRKVYKNYQEEQELPTSVPTVYNSIFKI